MKALVLHGFTGSLDTVSLLTEHLEDQGLEVAMPILRGHGTTPDHLFRVHWRDWVADARSGLLSVSPNDKEPLVIAGLSMGALLACLLAAEFPNRVKKVALVAPAFAFRSRLIHIVPLIKTVYRNWSGDPQFADPSLLDSNNNYPLFPVESFEQVLALMKVTNDLLPKVQCPVATYYAKKDPVVPPNVIKFLDKKLGSGPTKRHLYKRSYHEMLKDVEAEQVASDVLDFLLD